MYEEASHCSLETLTHKRKKQKHGNKEISFEVKREESKKAGSRRELNPRNNPRKNSGVLSDLSGSVVL